MKSAVIQSFKVLSVAGLTVLLGACAQPDSMLTVEDLQMEDDNSQLEVPIEEEDDDVNPEPLPTPTPPPGGSTKPNFFLNSSRVNLAHGPAQFWEGCQANQWVQGGYESDTKCSKAYVHPSFGAHLNRHFLNCAKTAALRAGMKEPARIFIRHWGSYNDRPARGSTRLSMHAYARAIDLVNMNLYDSQGQLRRVSTHVRDYSGANAIFYDEFRACWKATMPSTCRSSDTESSGSIGFPSSKAGGNTLHNDHLHLSLPLCAG